MKEILLSKGYRALVDDEDYEFINQWKWCYLSTGYAVREDKNSKMLLMHRIVARTPKGKVTDHINGNKLDNRKSNLRVCTSAQNIAYTKKRNGNPASVYKGVSLDKRRGYWNAEIWHNYKKYYLGAFKEERHAAMAWDIAARDLKGSFAYLNFPNAIQI
jgi:hypothetical protein